MRAVGSIAGNCWGLAHESQRENRANRILRRARKLRDRLGDSMSMDDAFPDKRTQYEPTDYVRLWPDGDIGHRTVSMLLMSARTVHASTPSRLQDTTEIKSNRSSLFRLGSRRI